MLSTKQLEDVGELHVCFKYASKRTIGDQEQRWRTMIQAEAAP